MACSKFYFGNSAFLSKDEYAKCCLMKGFKDVAGPILTDILKGITKGKMHWETLEEYALSNGMESNLFENYFSEHEIQTIRRNPNYNYFDLTLKFKCIRFFMNISSEVAGNEDLKCRILSQMNKLKSIRNNKLCHNRGHLTESQCHILAQSVIAHLGDLLEIVNLIWDKSRDIFNEKKKMEISIKQIMNGSITYSDFEYMCLLRVINFEVEPALYTMTKLICNDKMEDNYKDYLFKRGISKQTYKNTFFSDEKLQLQGKSIEMIPDLTLHCKIIMLCKEWHHKLKNDQAANVKLSLIITKIRGIRNLISHSMLSMAPDQCGYEAQNLRDCVRDLEDFTLEICL